MDDRSAAFLEVMIGFAIVGVLAFAIYALAGRIRMATSTSARTLNIRWPQIVLALILLVVVGLVILWQFPPLDSDGAWIARGVRWRDDPNAITFFVIMLAVAGGAILVFLTTLLLKSSPNLTAPPTEGEGTVAATEAAPAATVQTPAAGRLGGLLLLVLAILLLCWIYLQPALQYALTLRLLYPVALAVAVVLLFDKATRSWTVKTGGEAFREWLLCDLLVFFLILGFLNLLESRADAKYGSLIWDLLHIAAFFLVFWLLDRKQTRFRFLIAYLYLTLLPILLLIWRATQGTPVPKNLSWWSTIWPLFFLGVIFFVLELIAVVATNDREKQAVPAIKDAIYVILVGIVLIAAVPGAPQS
jgi:hypothetical protein